MNELDLDDELYYPKQHNQSRGSYPMVINSASTEMTPFKLGNNMSLQKSYVVQQQLGGLIPQRGQNQVMMTNTSSLLTDHNNHMGYAE